MNTVKSESACNEEFDLVIIGSGAAGMAAALTAHELGLTVAIFEKDAQFGGSTAVSGGAIWIPDNPKMRAAGMSDSREDALRYIAGEVGNAMNTEVVNAFLKNGPEMVEFMETHTDLQFEHREYSPDYHPDSPGAAMGGRVLDARTFDGRLLGDHFRRLKDPIDEFTVLGGMLLNRIDIGHFMNLTRRPTSALHALRLLARHLRDRLTYHRGTRLVLGQAVAGRLAYSVLKRNIGIRTGVALDQLLYKNGRVTGFAADDGTEFRARVGVVLATGGFPASQTMRREVMAHVREGSAHYSMSPKPATGDGIRAAQAIGADFRRSNKNAAFWAPVSLIPAQGGHRPFPHLFLDRAKPGLIAIDNTGRRFVNEASSYHDFVSGMLASGVHEAWLVCDHANLRKYGFGAVRPFPASYRPHIRSGYLKRAASLGELASLCGVPEQALAETVDHYNRDATVGTDSAFGKGNTAYQTYLGDPDNKPNPCLRPLKAPYYAIRIYPGDIGTSMGLSVNADAQVLDTDGSAVPGLYACGNDMNSVMGGAYPGAGITLGPALTFGYIAGCHAARAALKLHTRGDDGKRRG